MLVLWIIIGVIALLAIASLLPFSLHVNGARIEQTSLPVSKSFSYRAAFHWPWRTFGVGIRRDIQGHYIQLLCGNKCLYERKKRKKTRKKKEKKKEKSKGSFNLLRDRKLLSQLIKAGLKFLRDIFSCLQRPQLAGDIEIGLSDPAAMGVISGLLYAISPKGMMLDDLKIRPNYVDSIFTGEIDFSTGARPARITIALIKLVFCLPIKGLLGLLRHRKKAVKEKEVS